MKGTKWQMILGLILIILSVVLYAIHFLIFRDAHHIFIYLLGDIAFVPVEVFLVTVVIHRLLSEREKKTMITKLNMVIGAFFSEVGTRLLTIFSDFDKNSDIVTKQLSGVKNWKEKDFTEVHNKFKGYKSEIVIDAETLGELRKDLVKKRSFLLRLLENPNLLEHESFTDLLWAVFHLTEELENRKDFGSMPETDYEHLVGDIVRAYDRLVYEWISYMNHLRKNYPYLFSLAMRTNPFDEHASPVVT
jgi:hypothetical protein